MVQAALEESERGDCQTRDGNGALGSGQNPVGAHFTKPYASFHSLGRAGSYQRNAHCPADEESSQWLASWTWGDTGQRFGCILLLLAYGGRLLPAQYTRLQLGLRKWPPWMEFEASILQAKVTSLERLAVIR